MGFACDTDHTCRRVTGAGCSNGVKDGDESDRDCGGSCPPCADGRLCTVRTDCASRVCEDRGDGLRCQSLHCGSTACWSLGNGESCTSWQQCDSEFCVDGVCCDTACTGAGYTCELGVCTRCGDGVVSAVEECDDGIDVRDECPWTAEASNCTVCDHECKLGPGVPNYCGDGNVDAEYGEVCDDGGANSDAWRATAHCKLDCSGSAPHCGDGIVQAAFETCGEPTLPACPAAQECVACTCVATAPQAPVLAVQANGVKTLRFSWSAAAGATFYRLYEDPDGATGFVQIGADLTVPFYEHYIPVWRRTQALYRVQACNTLGCTPSAPIDVSGVLNDAIGYFKASNVGALDQFGYAVAIAGDGNTLAVGAYREDSNATGVNPTVPDNNSTSDSGAVYVFSRNGGSWHQEAYIKASNPGAGDHFGHSLSLSKDGSILAVGAPQEDSSGTGVNPPTQQDNSASNSGAVYIFSRVGTMWYQQAYLKASNTGSGDQFGISVSLSADGKLLAVGAHEERSSATGVNPAGQDDDSAWAAGAVYLFSRSGSVWEQQAYIKASNTNGADRFGWSVSLAADGQTLAVGAHNEDSGGTGVNPPTQADDSALNAGAVYIFSIAGGSWQQQAYIKPSNTATHSFFGSSVYLSGDGNTLAVGANGESRNGSGINPPSNEEDLIASSGAVYVFSRNNGIWQEEAYIKPSNPAAGHRFGSAVALTEDGNVLAVGAPVDNSGLRGPGTVYVFTRDDSGWRQVILHNGPNPDAIDQFGCAVSMTADGHTLAVGALAEASGGSGVHPPTQSDNSAPHSGAVYLY